jgi:hypothetical protein
VSPEFKFKLYLQKIMLILFGLAVFVLIFEIGSRIGGYIYMRSQESKNALSLEKKKVYRIVCLGESTTAEFGGKISYPRQLELILNEKNLGIKFSVINKGVPAIRMAQIIEKLDSILDEYDPDMVVAMTGINENFSYLYPPKKQRIPGGYRKVFFE